jgi:gliding motility-associated-like protein
MKKNNLAIKFKTFFIVFTIVTCSGSSVLFAQNTVTFNFTGQVQEWIVPPCVFQINVTARGGRGGGNLGANGATVSGILNVTPGQVLQIRVGGQGACPQGGWNGGGNSWAGSQGQACGGGGATDLRFAPYGLPNRQIVAAGGGGSGGGNPNNTNGGVGGCLTGGNGQNSFGQGGTGGTQTAGGLGGAGFAGNPSFGQAGSLGQGGNGGNDTQPSNSDGGGGGGGLYGGGGGGGDWIGFTTSVGGGAGGGGSSLTPPGGTCNAGNNNTNGQLVITWSGGGGGTAMQISSTGPYCAGQAIELSANLNTATFYNWFGPNGFTASTQNPTIPANLVNSSYTGTYFLHYLNDGCEDTISLNVIVYDSVLPIFNQVPPFCQDAQVPNLPTNANNNLPGTTTPIPGTWSPAINNQQTTTYSFTPNAGACATSASMTVEIIPNVTPQFTQVGPFCIGTEIDPLPTTSLNAVPGTWSPEINNQDTTTYTFTPTPGECAFPTTMTINIWPLVLPTFNQVAAICQDANLAPLPTTSLPTVLGPITGSWNPALNNQSTTTYTFTPNPNQCALDNTMTIQVWPRPIPTFNMDETIGCSPLRVFFENTTNISNPLACQWTLGNGDVISSCGNFIQGVYNTPGCYDVTLTMTYPGNCVNTFTAIQAICVEPDPIASFSANPTQAEVGQEVSFTNLSNGAVAYDWTFGDLTGVFNNVNPVHAYSSPGFYLVYLVAYTDFGCSDTTAQAILVEEPLIYYVPNTFTPDGNQYNPEFKPIMTQGIDIFGYQLLIFNRWGEVLFESNDAEFGWDGTYGGNICQDGTYVWKIKYQVLGVDKPQEMMGHVNLIR